jgi:hypothetical protein
MGSSYEAIQRKNFCCCFDFRFRYFRPAVLCACLFWLTRGMHISNSLFLSWPPPQISQIHTQTAQTHSSLTTYTPLPQFRRSDHLVQNININVRSIHCLLSLPVFAVFFCLVLNFSLLLFTPIFAYILFSSTCIVSIFIQIGHRNNYVIYPCTLCIYSLCNKFLLKKSLTGTKLLSALDSAEDNGPTSALWWERCESCFPALFSFVKTPSYQWPQM